MTDVNSILEERGAIYGKFKPLSELAQKLKFEIAKALMAQKKELTAVQATALENIIFKIARVVNGDSSYVENWVDIAGYAQLVVKELEK